MLNRILKKCVNFIFSGILLWIWVCLLFGHISSGEEYTYYSIAGKDFISYHIPNLVFLLCWIGIFLLIWLRRSHFLSQEKRKFLPWKKELFIWMAVFGVVEIFYTVNVFFYGGLDTQSAMIDASEFIKGNLDPIYHIHYLGQCPNNLYLHFLYVVAYEVGSLIGIDGYVIMVAVTVIGNILSVVLAGDVLHRLFHNRLLCRLAMILGGLLLFFTPFSIMPYTDILSVWIPILIFDVYVWVEQEQKSDVVKWLLIGLLAFHFYYLKALNVIIFLGIVACHIISAKRIDVKKILIFLLSMVVVFGSVSLAHKGVSSFMKYEPNEETALPMGYYLITGMDVYTYGGFSFESVNRMEEFDSQEKKNKEAFRILQERIDEFGLLGYGKHFKNKTILFFGDGSYGWGYNVSMLGKVLDSDSKITLFMRNLFYPSEKYLFSETGSGYGKYFLIYCGVAQFILIGLWFFMSIYGFSKKREDNPFGLVLETTFIGVFLFCMLFEMSTRLLLSYLPLFVVLGALGLNVFQNNLKRATGMAETRRVAATRQKVDGITPM